jgi:hypothetical protein
VDDIIVKEYGIDDRDGCIELLKKTFPGKSDETTFRWRFESERRIRPLLVCARTRNQVVAFCSWLPWEFTYKGQRLVGYQNGEAATDRLYRGRGLLGRMLRLADRLVSERGGDFFFCYPNSMSYGPTVKAGYYDVGRHVFSLRLINPLSRRTGDIRSISPHDTVASMKSEDDKITPHVDNDYCRWRYAQNTKDFEIIEYSSDRGWALFFLRAKKWKRLNELVLLDCQFDNYDPLFVRDAVHFLDRAFSRKALYMRTFFNVHSRRGKALMGHFSISVKTKFYTLCVKPMSEKIDGQTFFALRNWDVMPHCVDEL